MAEAGISIPSPTAFLRKTPPPPTTSSAPPIDDQPRAPKYARKASSAPKKVSTGKISTTAIGEPKQKQSKSRNGCVTCKTKRLKCDEEKPTCQQCAKRKVECGGYRKDFKWRPFEETTVKVMVDRQKRPSPPRNASGLASGSATPPTAQEAPASPHGLPLSKRSAHVRTISVEGTQARLADLHFPAKQTNPTLDPTSPANESLSSIAEIARGSPPADPPLSPLSRETQTVQISGITVQPLQGSFAASSSASPGPLVGSSPTLIELLLPFGHGSLGVASPDFIPFSMPEDFHMPISPLLGQDSVFDSSDVARDLPEDEAEFSRSAEEARHIWENRYTTPPPSRSSESTLDRRITRWDEPNSHILQQPFFAEGSMEMLSFRFDKLTCGILSVMDGPSENPWRTLLWPLAQDSPGLMHAVLAMTAYHSSMDVPSLRVVGHEHKDRAIGFIREGIRDSSMSNHKAIATTLCLGFAESWDQHTATGNSHIKGAQALVRQTLENHESNPSDGIELATLKFLVNAWVYMDVIARLTSVDSDYSNDFDNTFLFSSSPPPLVMGGPGPPGFGIDFGIGIDARLDSMMGCANTLFPLIGRVANLVKRICRSTTTSPALISTANELQSALEQWSPPDFIEPPEDPSSQVRHSIQTAEAYRWATLLHLHRSVPELPSPPAALLAQKSLSYLATVPLSSRTTIVHAYPLLVAGSEASSPEDRDFVRSRWAAMAARKRTGSVEKCSLVTTEVWRRKDAYTSVPSPRRGHLVPTSSLTSPRQQKRSIDDFDDMEAGRKGVVYTWVDGEETPSESGKFPPRPRAVENIGGMDPAETVRGHLCWVGVMWDWGWEVLLG